MVLLHFYSILGHVESGYNASDRKDVFGDTVGVQNVITGTWFV
jgi:hypothetical protein